MNKQEIETAIEIIASYKKAFESFNHGDFTNKIKAFELAISALEQQLTNGWIPVSEKLPEENIDNITNDFLEYNVSLKFEYAECTRTYKYGQRKWWNDGTDMSEYVIAWQPLPEAYKE